MTTAVASRGRGESAVKRLERDVLSQRGLRTVVLLEGVNDINNDVPSSQALIDGYRDIVNRAHTAGIRPGPRPTPRLSAGSCHRPRTIARPHRGVRRGGGRHRSRAGAHTE